MAEDIETTVGHDAWELSRALVQVLVRRLGPEVLPEINAELETRAATAEKGNWPQYAEGVRKLIRDLDAGIFTTPT